MFMQQIGVKRMLLGDFNILLLLFLTLFFTLIVNTSTALHLLLIAELLWITLYAITLLLGLISNDLNLLSLTFFFLALSASELGAGLMLLSLQNFIYRTLTLTSQNDYANKYNERNMLHFYVNKTKWKF